MSSVDSEDRARCPILSCGTYLMLERTRKGTRAGEREKERARERQDKAASSVLCTRLGRRGGGTHAARASTAFPGLQDFAKTLGVQFGECFLARRHRRPGKLSWGAEASLAPRWPRFVCDPALIASSLPPLTGSPSARPAPAGDGVRLPGSQGERSTVRPAGHWSHLHC